MSEKVTLCIIDDISSVVEGIAYMPDWQEHGIDVVGTALDGEEGLQLIRRLRPDIVLTDIRMPHMDGIEMLAKLKQEQIESKVIFFSGYTDFTYAQQAVRLGAFDYVTKPHSLPQIVEMINKAKEAVAAERRERQSIQEIRQKVRESLPILRQEFLSLLLRHPADVDSIRKRCVFLQMDLPQRDICVLVIEIDQLAGKSHEMQMEEVELIRFSLQNIVEETVGLHTRGVVFRDTTTRFAIICHSPSALQLSELAEAICQHISRFTKFTVTVGYGRPAAQLTDIPYAYEEACTALTYQFYTGGNTALGYTDVAGKGGVLPRYAKAAEQELGMSLLSGNSARAIKSLESIFTQLSSVSPMPEPAYLISTYNEVASYILRLLLENVPYEELHRLELYAPLAGWEDHVSLQLLQERIMDLCVRGCKLIEGSRQSDAERIVHEAIRFIRSNLHTELSLQDCARHVHLSSNYFAHIFKRVTGMTFVQFLTQERMETAKRMLLEGMQVQTISAEVGYEDRRYFSQLFKKHTGMTPSAFKSQYEQQL